MGLISARFRRKKDETEPAPTPVAEPIKRYRVQSLPAMAVAQQAPIQLSSRQFSHVGTQVGVPSPPILGQSPVPRPQAAGHPAPAPRRPAPPRREPTSLTHRDDFGDVTQLWKRGSIRILEPSDMSNSSASMWSDPSLETQLSFKRGPEQPVQLQPASPTFSMCGSTHSLSPSPSLDYSASFSSDASVASRLSVRSIGARQRPKSEAAPEKVDAGIPPLLPAHRTFSGSPHHGSFYRPKHKHTQSAASDYIPLHVFTREARPAAPEPPKLKKRFNLDGYQGGLKVVNITPPSSPPPAFEPSRESSREPGRYRVPSKASLMDY